MMVFTEEGGFMEFPNCDYCVVISTCHFVLIVDVVIFRGYLALYVDTRLERPGGWTIQPSTTRGFPHHIQDSMNTSTDLQKRKPVLVLV